MRQRTDDDQPPSSGGRRKHRHHRRRHRFSIPAPLVFFAAAGLMGASSALVYLRGDGFLPIAAGACLFTLLVLVVNERSGFSRSKRMRRSGEARTAFNQLEIAILFGLLMVGILVSVLTWMT